MAEKKRLPVLQPEVNDEDDDRERPLWQWAALGVALTFTLWVPLAATAQAISNRLVASTLGDFASTVEMNQAIVRLSTETSRRLSIQFFLLHAVALGVSSFVGGFIVGKYGGKGGPRAAIGCGLLVAAFAVALATATGSIRWTSALVVLLSAPLSFFGGRVGARKARA